MNKQLALQTELQTTLEHHIADTSQAFAQYIGEFVASGHDDDAPSVVVAHEKYSSEAEKLAAFIISWGGYITVQVSE